jgi:hypothetical protein
MEPKKIIDQVRELIRNSGDWHLERQDGQMSAGFTVGVKRVKFEKCAGDYNLSVTDAKIIPGETIKAKPGRKSVR